MTDQDKVRDYFTRDAARFDAIYEQGRQRKPIQRLVDGLFRRRELRQRVEACLRAVGDTGSVLEIGCGSGRVAVALAQAGVGHVTGIDISQEMVRLATDLARRAGEAEKCTFLCCQAETFEAAEPFDAVVALGLMDYVAEPEAMLKRMKAFARGRFIVSFPRRWMMLNPARRLWLKTKRCGVYFYDRRCIEEAFDAAGLELKDLVGIGFAPLVGSYVAVGSATGG